MHLRLGLRRVLLSEVSMNKFCDESGKRCFASKREARIGMRRLAARLRVYFCKDCKAFHLTKEQSRSGKERRGEFDE